MAYLVMMRHGESEWNAANRLAGTADIGLTPAGRKQARLAAGHYKDIPLHVAYTSELRRTQQTLEEGLGVLGLHGLPSYVQSELNERHCGVYTGRLKTEIAKEAGSDVFARLDSEWDNAPPGGESMADLREKLVPFFNIVLLPRLADGKNILVVSSYNPHRILKWHLQKLAESEIGSVAAGNAEVCIATINRAGVLENIVVNEGLNSVAE